MVPSSPTCAAAAAQAEQIVMRLRERYSRAAVRDADDGLLVHVFDVAQGFERGIGAKKLVDETTGDTYLRVTRVAFRPYRLGSLPWRL